jgi:L-ascorbate metabolism protein UlaG (beta-lactamase superfamily)
VRLHPILLFLLLGVGPVAAQSPPATNVPPRALPVSPADLTATGPLAVAGGVNVHWYGHGFIYLTSSVGIRCAIDPFGSDTVHYKYPDHLSADFELISHEAEDHSAGQIFGDPLIFRSVMAVGLNRANGIPFYGVALQKDPSGQGGSNTAFTLTFDGVRFCYLGQINMPLLAEEKEELGHADVVFLPVGLQTLSVGDFNEIVKELGATMVIPINYKTDLSGILNLRTLDEYLSATKFPIRRVDSDEIVVSRTLLPSEPTVYVLKSPTEAAPAPPPQ